MENDKIKIDWKDINKPEVDDEIKRQRQGYINRDPGDSPGIQTGNASSGLGKKYFYSAVFYTALAGLVMALFGWGLTEVIRASGGFDSDSIIMSSALFFAIFGSILGIGLNSVEGVICRSTEKAIKGGVLGFALGFAGGFLAGVMGQIIYGVLLSNSNHNITLVIFSRALGWALAGMLLGIGQGLPVGSKKKIWNAFLGGVIGGAIGGLLFDPIGLIFKNDVASRLIALSLLGSLIGGFIGLIENLLKEAWIQVTDGPLKGKQFVIYKDQTVFGSSPKADIFLFKDQQVNPNHAVLNSTQNGYELAACQASGTILVNDTPISKQRLKNGDTFNIGQYSFLYGEKIKR